MIQRIQSVYLLIVVALACCTLFMPSVDFMPADVELQSRYTLKFMNLVGEGFSDSNISTWLLFLLSAIVPAVALVTIFLYKKRPLQISLTIGNIILMVGYYVLLGIVVWTFADRLNATWHLHFAVVFPLINAILSYLALRGIIKDEALVRSLDRLR